MSKETVFSLTRGYSFSFVEDGNTVRAWFSAFSGLEKIYVNEKLVSSQRNFSTDSTNIFTIGPNEYSTNLRVTNFFKGPFVCTLTKNGTEYKRQKLIFPKPSPSSKKLPLIASLSLFIMLGLLFGIARSYWQLPQESFYVFILVIGVIAFIGGYKDHQAASPIIEDEQIV